MQICVCGWYYYPAFYNALRSLPYDIAIVGNRKGDTKGIPLILRENTGLDWGAYNHFVMELWDEKSKVFFLQDDTQILNPGAILRVEQCRADQAFVFTNLEEKYLNSGGHGRAMVCSPQFLRWVKMSGGFWYDAKNTGFIASGHFNSETPPPGCQHHNAGIHHFMRFLTYTQKTHPKWSVSAKLYEQHLRFGRRGKF